MAWLVARRRSPLALLVYLGILPLLSAFAASTAQASLFSWRNLHAPLCQNLLTQTGGTTRVDQVPSHAPTAVVVPALPGQRKVLILSCTVGNGHRSMANVLKQTIESQSPGAAVSIVEVETLIPSWLNRAQQWFFWTIVKNAPWIYDIVYDSMMRRAERRGLGQVYLHVPTRSLERLILQENPDTVFAVHQVIGDRLALLRTEGRLPESMRLALVATDYFVEFLPRVARHLDATFVPHPRLVEGFAAAGAPRSRVHNIGMPVNPLARQRVDRVAVLENLGLDPSVRTVTIASGGEGVANYPVLAASLARSLASPTRPLQIIAVCGRNARMERRLLRLREELARQNVTLVVRASVTQADLFSAIQSSDLYITKSGGLSPIEGYNINVPMILLDIYGGHERRNAVFHGDLGVALVVRDQARIGETAAGLLADSVEARNARAAMARAQQAIAATEDLDPVRRFIDTGNPPPTPDSH